VWKPGPATARIRAHLRDPSAAPAPPAPAPMAPDIVETLVADVPVPAPAAATAAPWTELAAIGEAGSFRVELFFAGDPLVVLLTAMAR
jgi:hypothetical protein